MEEKNQQDNGISESELIEKASSLDKIVAKPKGDEPRGVKKELPAGNYMARVVGSFLNKNKSGDIFMNFQFAVCGSLHENDEGESVVKPRVISKHSRGFSLSKEYCIEMLLDLFRDCGVVRTDGEPIITGGDLLRSRGVPDGTWVVITVRNSKYDGVPFITGIYRPNLNQVIQAKSIYEQLSGTRKENDNSAEEEREYEPTTDTGNNEPPF